MRLDLDLHMQDDIIQNDSHQKQNFEIVSCSLKNMSLHRVGACRQTKCQSFNNLFEDEDRTSQKRKIFDKSI